MELLMNYQQYHVIGVINMTKLLATDINSNIALIKQLSTSCFPDHLYLAQLTAAQAILEGDLEENDPKHKGLGGSLLAMKYCNLFGMKPGIIRAGTMPPGYVYLSTDEYVQNEGMVPMRQPFLCNKDIEDSLAQHKQLFVRLDRYKSLWLAQSFEQIAEAVHEAGYATDPNYPNKLIAIFNRHNLGNM